jgi:hypothetical protein
MGMKIQTKAFLVGGIGLIGAVICFGLTVYPFQYGVLESALLGSLFVFFGLFKTIIGNASFE